MNNEKVNKLAGMINTDLGINLFDNDKKQIYVDARSLFCYVLRNQYTLTFHEIAEVMRSKGRLSQTHATVYCSIKGFDEVKRRNKKINDLYRAINNELFPKSFLIARLEKINNNEVLTKVNKIVTDYENNTKGE